MVGAYTLVGGVKREGHSVEWDRGVRRDNEDAKNPCQLAQVHSHATRGLYSSRCYGCDTRLGQKVSMWMVLSLSLYANTRLHLYIMEAEPSYPGILRFLHPTGIQEPIPRLLFTSTCLTRRALRL